MTTYRYRLVNVFAEQPFGGNPLAVFPNAHGLDDATMQLIARQFNLSETVFVFPSEHADAALRIFTPSYELPFAGHPTLGSAYVLHQERHLDDRFALETRAGVIPLEHAGGVYTLSANVATSRSADLSRAAAAEMLGLEASDIAHDPEWVNAGSEQLLIRLSNRAAVLTARPDPVLFKQRATLRPGHSVAYVWHVDGNVATVRLFFEQLGAVIEDPGTGSACANLGGWCVLNGLAPLVWRVEQGEVIDRPNVLYLSVDKAGQTRVGGRVIDVADGEFHLPG
ncbi:PhzF family phenazine biosynthesis protein [Crenobacter sp. SG2305]|uniref:PhzF family phenazine biosynthesis protein n=1 Tax=Crenobacter oryzisoli TaxID=3056844 RepID=UPI0025AB3B89|nr:PhzF family phenazine biosynthesis protein [Crenobacter sp. SG2305]MDN0084600.1 PhzF family phenazine biosynthesis protein [Crenobacter sp. SG2305]